MPTVLCYITQGGYCHLNCTISCYGIPIYIRFSAVTQVTVKPLTFLLYTLEVMGSNRGSEISNPDTFS